VVVHHGIFEEDLCLIAIILKRTVSVASFYMDEKKLLTFTGLEYTHYLAKRFFTGSISGRITDTAVMGW